MDLTKVKISFKSTVFVELFWACCKKIKQARTGPHLVSFKHSMAETIATVPFKFSSALN